jgi:hypothetical protein
VARISDKAVANYAAGAGFRGNALIIAVAIALEESGGDTTNIGPVGEVGLWQIYPRAHPTYSVSRLREPGYNAAAAWAISKHGTYWHPWTTWNNGTYRTKLARARNAASGAVPTKDTGIISPLGSRVHQRWEPAWLKDMVAWIHNPSIPMYIRRDHKSQAEGGVDLTSKGGTPVYALETGRIIGAGTFVHSNGNPGYGVVTQRIVVPGHGTQDIYYQHINIAPGIRFCKGGQCTGQILKKGDTVGWVRGNVGEVEVGFNAGWGGIWGTNHPGPWPDDPRPMIKALMDAGPPGTPSTSTIDPGQPGTPGDTSALSSLLTGFTVQAPPTFTPVMDQVHETLVATPGFYGIALALYEAEHFPGWIDLTQKEEATILGNKVPIPDIIGEVRSVGATFGDNFLAFTIRSGLVTIGLILLIMLIIKASQPVAAPVLRIAALTA